jgi:hypothetical protein
MHSHGESPHEFDSLLLGDVVEEIISSKSDAVAIVDVLVPHPSIVFVCSSANPDFTGSQSSSKVSHKVISLGRGTILKCSGTCEGQWEQRILVSSLSVRSSSRGRASATWLSPPQNHWLYSCILCFRECDAWRQATLRQIIAWIGDSPSPSLQQRAVGHGEGAVTASEVTGNDIHPQCDDHRGVFKQVVECLEFKVWVEVISPHESFVAVSS